MRQRIHGIIILACLLPALSGCTPGIRMDIRVYSDPEQKTNDLKRFRVEPNTKENPLLAKELSSILKERLLRKGFAYDNSNPDIIVAIDFNTTAVKYYIPPTTQFVSHYVPGETKTYTGTASGTPVQITEQSAGHYELRPQVTQGYTDTAYHHSVKIYFTRHNKESKDRKGELFWRGEGDSENMNSDIRHIAPFLIDEILSEYPVKTGKPNIRTLKLQ